MTNFSTLFTFISLSLLVNASSSFTKRSAHHRRAAAAVSASASASSASVTVSAPSACDISTALLNVPGAGDVNPTPGDVLKYITLGVGSIQYQCNSGSWSPIAQKGELYDISCLYSPTDATFAGLTASVLNVASDPLSSLGDALNGITNTPLKELGTFYMHGKQLKFDMSQRRGGRFPNDANAGFVVTNLEADQAAPVASYDIDWQKYHADGGKNLGSLASSVFRVSTAGGQPADPSCTGSGTTITVPFSAQFWFFEDALLDDVLAEGTVVNAADAPKHCDIAAPSKEKKRSLAVLLQSVIYGDTGKECFSNEECTKLCLADKECEGWVLSTEDGEGYTKKGVTSNEIIFSSVFNAAVVRDITGTEYIDRYGFVQQCPESLIGSEDNTGCVAPVCT